MATVKELAQQFFDAVSYKNGDYDFNEKAEDWMKKIEWNFPGNTSYVLEYMHSAAELLCSQDEEMPDQEAMQDTWHEEYHSADVYENDLVEWFAASKVHRRYMESVVRDFGPFEDYEQHMRAAQQEMITEAGLDFIEEIYEMAVQPRFVVMIGMHGYLPEGNSDLPEFEDMESAIEHIMEEISVYNNPFVDANELKQKLRDSGIIELYAELYQNPDNAPYPSIKTSIWYAQIVREE